MSEAKVTAQVRAYLQNQEKIHHDFVWFKLSDRFTSSLPDFYIATYGASIWIELKDIGKKPSKLQTWTLKRLKKAGCKTLATDNLKDVIEIIESVLT